MVSLGIFFFENYHKNSLFKHKVKEIFKILWEPIRFAQFCTELYFARFLFYLVILLFLYDLYINNKFLKIELGDDISEY